MIEKMIIEVKKFLPLEIAEVTWDGTMFQMWGSIWNFTSLSAWRITIKNKMIFGCFDKDSTQLVKCLKNIEIIDIDFQDSSIKIDPTFVLSNELKLEIFSTDTYEPWTFEIRDLGIFIATPNEPQKF